MEVQTASGRLEQDPACRMKVARDGRGAGRRCDPTSARAGATHHSGRHRARTAYLLPFETPVRMARARQGSSATRTRASCHLT
jgi:hypothetical protein